MKTTVHALGGNHRLCGKPVSCWHMVTTFHRGPVLHCQGFELGKRRRIKNCYLSGELVIENTGEPLEENQRQDEVLKLRRIVSSANRASRVAQPSLPEPKCPDALPSALAGVV